MSGSTQQQIAALEKKVGSQARSPLFALLAQYYLEAGRAQDALHLCDAGLAHHPFYTTGHLIKGKSLVALNMHAEARREFEFVCDFLPGNKEIQKLLQSVPLSTDETLSAEEAQPASTKQQIPEIVPTPTVVIPKEPVAAPPPIEAKDFGFGTTTEPLKEIETPPPFQQAEEQVPSGSSFFDTLTHATETPVQNDAFGFGTQVSTEILSSEKTITPPDSSAFGDFTAPPQETTPAYETPPQSFDFSATSKESVPFAPMFMEGVDSFDAYASRRRLELSGENTVSLDEYLNGPPAEIPAPPDITLSTGVQNKIEEIAEKLQDAGRITPVIDFVQKDTPTVSEQDTPSGMGFVTPTLAEIYAKQGWYDDAIKAYKTLARNKPAERERFESRIAELEELRKQQPSV